MDEPLEPGSIHIRIGFRGTLNDKLRGFYRSTFTDDDGAVHTIAVTQFQSTDARRAFPCWDEPAFKATFASTLVVDRNLLAISNTAVVEQADLDDGRRRLTFAPTMPMSTYLVAFVVGPLAATDPVDVDGVPVRVVHRPGQAHLTTFALEVATHALRWFTQYYEIPYPSDKVDLVGIPDFAFGAMENLGCATFRDVLLLVDPDGATQPELELVAAVVSHELAHMWFGDLVTMRWWEGIWLNEAFATFMETACVDAFRPDWDVWTGFCRGRAAAFETDALATTRPIEYPVVSPADAEAMFDILTYEKGGSVVRMLEQYLGEDAFRDGVRHYLRTHAYGNTETSDLWDAIEEVTGEPVRRIMDGWILQGGHPVIEVGQRDEGTTLFQRHFTLDPDAADDRTWSVPLRLRTADGDTRVLLEDPSAVVSRLDVRTANADASGFYRVKPDMALLGELAAGDATDLRPTERHGLVDDAWALTISDRLAAADFLRLARAFEHEDDLTVWQALVSRTGRTRTDRRPGRPPDGAPGPASRGHRPTRPRPSPRPRPAGFGRGPTATRERRATLAAPARRGGRRRGDSIVSGPLAELRPSPRSGTLAAAALTVVARHGGTTDDDSLPSARPGAPHADPQTEQRNLRALADLPRPGAREAVTARPDIRRGQRFAAQDGAYVLRPARPATTSHAGQMVWEFISRRVGVQINRHVPEQLGGSDARRHRRPRPAPKMPMTAWPPSSPTHPVPAGRRSRWRSCLEEQRVRAAFRTCANERSSGSAASLLTLMESLILTAVRADS